MIENSKKVLTIKKRHNKLWVQKIIMIIIFYKSHNNHYYVSGEREKFKVTLSKKWGHKSLKVQLKTGMEMYYEEHGSGTPLILIPGTGCDHQVWDLQVGIWSKHFRVIAVDNRGAGQSTIFEDPEKYSVEIMADDIAALIEQLELGPCHLSGHSVGASIVQQVAIRHPALVKSIQLHSTWGKTDEWFKRAFVGTMKYPTELKDPHVTFRTNMMWAASPKYLETRQPEIASEMVTKCLVKNPYLDAYYGILGHLHADSKYDALHQLDQIQVPTLITAGEIDVLVPKRYSEEVLSKMKGAQYHEFKGEHGSHFALWEMWEEFTSVALGFMNFVEVYQYLEEEQKV
jgi:pimeloyl-ACP methyl ester carboxylesterase